MKVHVDYLFNHKNMQKVNGQDFIQNTEKVNQRWQLQNKFIFYFHVITHLCPQDVRLMEFGTTKGVLHFRDSTCTSGRTQATSGDLMEPRTHVMATAGSTEQTQSTTSPRASSGGSSLMPGRYVKPETSVY